MAVSEQFRPDTATDNQGVFYLPFAREEEGFGHALDRGATAFKPTVNRSGAQEDFNTVSALVTWLLENSDLLAEASTALQQLSSLLPTEFKVQTELYLSPEDDEPTMELIVRVIPQRWEVDVQMSFERFVNDYWLARMAQLDYRIDVVLRRQWNAGK